MVIVNFWLMLSPAAELALKGVAQIGPEDSTGEPVPAPDVVNSAQFPLLRRLSPGTRKLVRNFPERGISLLPTGVWNCYATGTGNHEFTRVREDLQMLNDSYPDDFVSAGSWDVATGQPLGGVGSPWFITPPELPGKLGGLRDIVLMAGQKPRKFV